MEGPGSLNNIRSRLYLYLSYLQDLSLNHLGYGPPCPCPQAEWADS
jgi:hypothetical protein